MANMLTNIVRIPELRNRILFTIGCLIVYRIGAHISTPGINPTALKALIEGQAGKPMGSVLSFIDLFAGGAFKKFTIFALGIMPYISSSIIFNLLTTVIPHLEQLSKEGEMGRKKIQQYTRYGTILICLIQSSAISRWISNDPSIVVFENTWFFTFIVAITITTGTMFLMWLGEQITERGIGNGISLIIFAGIAARIPHEFREALTKVESNQFNPVSFLVLMIVFITVIFFVVFEQEGQRRIPVQFARKVVGRKVYGSQSSYIPFKINPTGVIPIIFASALVMVPSQIAVMVGDRIPFIGKIGGQLAPGNIPYMVIYGFLVIAFAYFYTTVQFNPVEIAENLKKQGGYIPGIRPGTNTRDYLQKVLVRLTLAGSLFLAFIAIFPDLLQKFPLFRGMPQGLAYVLGGTSLLILVAVDLDTMKQIESQLVMREYDGFMARRKKRRARY
jgi:preprotein translocase subunit SecY